MKESLPQNSTEKTEKNPRNPRKINVPQKTVLKIAHPLCSRLIMLIICKISDQLGLHLILLPLLIKHTGRQLGDDLDLTSMRDD